MTERATVPAGSAADGGEQRLALDAALTELRGVGPALATRLTAAGLRTVRDLLLFFPRRHAEIAELDEPDVNHVGEFVRIPGRLERATRAWLPGRRSLVTAYFAPSTGASVGFAATFFNQPYLIKSLRPGHECSIEGVLEVARGRFTLRNPTLIRSRAVIPGSCRVRYPELPGVSEQRLRGWIRHVLDNADFNADLGLDLPPALAVEFAPTVAALRSMHQPANVGEHESARRRFAVHEAVKLFRQVDRIRRQREAGRAPDLQVVEAAEELAAQVIPFEWTTDQARVVAGLRRRLAGATPMGVLLQGDVGTGKTAVALDAALVAIAGGYQVAFMAPTDLLADQHFELLAGWLDGVARVGRLTSRLPRAERVEVDRAVRHGELDLVIGTHALFAKTTVFQRLGLVVIDEQHRFGVEQRAALLRKGADRPHLLVMTATPIPRTLTLSLFGDLDVEVLRDRPSGRSPAKGVFVPREQWSRVLRSIRRCVGRGGQVFVVCPAVGEDGSLGGAVRLAKELAGSFRCALVHGRMDIEKRQQVTEGFRAGEFDVLCGTTVLEVGIDIPGATLMVIVAAERFGLATLHQLRGRVGRGGRRGLCILTGESTVRTAAICETQDGFEIAERDLRLRGSGELVGQRQSGCLDFTALDPLDDLDLLQRARDAVRKEPTCE